MPVVAIDCSEPTDIIAVFGLEHNVSGYFFRESNLDYPLAVDSCGIDIRISIIDGAT